MSAQKKKEDIETWDVESIFNPPKHDFGKGHGNDGQEQQPSTPTTTRVSPPRFLGKKRKVPGDFRRTSPSSEYGSEPEQGERQQQQWGHRRSARHRQVFRSDSNSKLEEGDDGNDIHAKREVFGTSKSEDQGGNNAKQNIFRSPSRSYEQGEYRHGAKREERQDSSTAAAASAASAASSASSSYAAPSPSQAPATDEEQDETFPIKFSLSHDFKSDASFCGGPHGVAISGGGWNESLHMAPLPPYVQRPHQATAAWGGQRAALPPALPSAGGTPPYPHGHHHHHAAAAPANPYYSPYYHQHQHHQQASHHHRRRPAVPDPATSALRQAPGTPSSSSAADPSIAGPPGRDDAHSTAAAHGAHHRHRGSSSEAAHWRKHHHLLHQFLLQFGHCNVPRGYGVGTHYEGLHRWCNEQRAEYQRMCRNDERGGGSGSDGGGGSDPGPSAMTPTRVRILTSMGFVWGHSPNAFRPSGASASAIATSGSGSGGSKPYSSWDKWMELLSDYRHVHGNVDVPLKYEANPSLGTFVNRQRTEHRKMQNGKPTSMTPSRVADLDRLGFTWAIRESHTSWEDRFAELKEFRDANGHCNVPKIYSKNPSLGYWVNEQRFQYRRLQKKKSSYMTDEKIRALDGLDFKGRWSLRETNGSWENWLKELHEYKDQHGDVDVPLKYRHNQALGVFVNRQRTEHRKLQQGLQTSLTQERIDNLNELGFKWAIRVSRTPWETRLDELKKFKEQHGHCNVPSTYPKNQPLAYWVFKQRGQYRIYKKRDYVMPGKQMCHMTPERISKLDAIGFEWNPPRRIK